MLLFVLLAVLSFSTVAVPGVDAEPLGSPSLAPLEFDSQSLVPTPYSDHGGGLSRTIRRSRVHHYAGYTTLALATTTAVLGLAGLGEFHGPVAISTIATGAVSYALGAIAYSDRLDEVWPHSLLNGLALGGMVANLFLFPTGSTPHIATGAASVALMYAGYAYIAFAY